MLRLAVGCLQLAYLLHTKREVWKQGADDANLNSRPCPLFLYNCAEFFKEPGNEIRVSNEKSKENPCKGALFSHNSGDLINRNTLFLLLLLAVTRKRLKLQFSEFGKTLFDIGSRGLNWTFTFYNQKTGLKNSASGIYILSRPGLLNIIM